MKRISVYMAFFIIFTSLLACYPKYEITHPELYTVAVNSLLWNRGYSFSADATIAPDISVVETDEYGRILFQYTEKYFSQDIAFSSLLILQSSDEEFVYFYEDVNLACKEKPPYAVEQVKFDQAQIDDLKTKNDWNMPINIDKCVKKRIINEKMDVPIDDNTFEEVFSSYENYVYNITFTLTEDEAGKIILYSIVCLKDNNDYSNKYVVSLFENGLLIDSFEPEALYSYQQELREFKASNGWGAYSGK